MAESKRRGPRKAKKKGDGPERLTTVNLAVNAVATLVGAPLLFIAAALLWMGQFGGEELNQNLFLGGVAALLGVFVILLCGFKVAEHLRARRRFRELLEGAQKSALIQNMDELNTLARALGPPYRRRLDGRLGELGIKR
ncbi:MAG TPA: hypothetical protein VGR28_09735 [Candidatus Thermoplasmatota archaeon]|jgi:hypothetical protein|nr:hypothetical protein [Candidatus Thermoplasmatota archaeon]